MKRFTLALAFTLVMFGVSRAEDKIRLCTGGTSGVYYAAGETIRSMAGNSLKIENVATTGTIDSLGKLLDSDECDATIAQPDGPVMIARQSPAKAKKLRKIADLHREYLHVLCGRDSEVEDLSDLSPKNSLDVGAPGSGAWLLWQNILAEDDYYASVPVKNEGGILALSAVASGDTTCMIVPAGLRNGTVNEADVTFGDSIKLVGANDKDFNDAVDIKGEPLYEYVGIPSGVYKNKLQTGLFGSSVSTISWKAAVYVNTDRVSPDVLGKFIQVVSRSANGIKAEYGK